MVNLPGGGVPMFPQSYLLPATNPTYPAVGTGTAPPLNTDPSGMDLMTQRQVEQRYGRLNAQMAMANAVWRPHYVGLDFGGPNIKPPPQVPGTSLLPIGKMTPLVQAGWNGIKT